jgi:Leucine-rich repeat (LRR) protein
MPDKPERSIILRPDAQIERSASGKGRIVAAMIDETLSLARAESQPPPKRFKIGSHEWCESDYLQILVWANALLLDPETLIERLLDDRSIREFCSDDCIHKWSRTQFVCGRIVGLHWDLTSLPLERLELEENLEVAFLSVFNVRRDSRCSNILTQTMNVRQLTLQSRSLKCIECSSLGLEQLDLSQLGQLEELYCRTNRISSLELPASCNLKVLQCSGNSISRLNLSRIPQLEELYCACNKIGELELSNTPMLTKLQCGDNEIATLELAVVQCLTDLDCSFSPISTLDLASIPRLRRLDCSGTSVDALNLADVPMLQSLSCYSTLVSELDLRYVPNLESLICDNTKITQLNLMAVPRLNELSCTNTGIDELDIRPLEHLAALNYDRGRTRLLKRPDQGF